ncbi:response regulator [Dehalogenimonas sp. THU2]|uniref:response regulator n=1 Tax=Dehalogenimonas sp. THU2 TaxID=3151121 RepID=UPI003218342A
MSNKPIASKPLVLVVDDSPDVISLVCGLLRDSYTLKIATNGKSALKVIESGVIPDLILLDIMMPQMDGYATLNAIKQLPETNSIPVIMLTAEGYLLNKTLAFNMGAVDYITKPVNASDLISRVAAALGK